MKKLLPFSSKRKDNEHMFSIIILTKHPKKMKSHSHASIKIEERKAEQYLLWHRRQNLALHSSLTGNADGGGGKGWAGPTMRKWWGQNRRREKRCRKRMAVVARDIRARAEKIQRKRKGSIVGTHCPAFEHHPCRTKHAVFLSFRT